MKADVRYGNISLNSSYHRNVSQKVAEKIKTHIFYSATFSRKSFRL